jgi:mediator of RNA polymerase II transcription subunit 4
LACDEALSSAINLARKHQIKQRRINALEKEILELDARWREIVSELQSGRKELEEVIEEGEERIKAIEQAKKGKIPSNLCVARILKFLIASIPYPELLTYAQSISAFTSAPPNMPDLSLPGQPPPPLFFPPFPNEEKMRRGHLNAEAPLGLLGETHSVGRRKNLVTRIIYLFLHTNSTNSLTKACRCQSASAWCKPISTRPSSTSTAILRLGSRPKSRFMTTPMHGPLQL